MTDNCSSLLAFCLCLHHGNEIIISNYQRYQESWSKAMFGFLFSWVIGQGPKSSCIKTQLQTCGCLPRYCVNLCTALMSGSLLAIGSSTLKFPSKNWRGWNGDRASTRTSSSSLPHWPPRPMMTKHFRPPWYRRKMKNYFWWHSTWIG